MTRRFFIELDKAGAEWVVVAYLSGDPNMIDVIEKKKDPHVYTGSIMTGLPEAVVAKESKLVKYANDPQQIELLREQIPELKDAVWLPRSFSIRQIGKKSNHGLNYKEDWFMFGHLNEISAQDSKRIVSAYRNDVYPNIPIWWNSIEEELRTNNRTLHNLLGHKRQFFDAWTEQLVKAAISYKPQSTVGQIVRRGGRMVYAAMEKGKKPFDKLDLHANVHDQLLLSYPYGQWYSAAEAIILIDEMLSPVLEAKGRQFTIRTDLKVGALNWSRMEEASIVKDVAELGRNIKEAVLKSEVVNVKKVG